MPGIADWIFWSQLWIPCVTKASSDQPAFPHTRFNFGEPPEVKWATEPCAEGLQRAYPMRPTSMGIERGYSAALMPQCKKKKPLKFHLPFVQKLPSYRTDLIVFVKIMYWGKRNCLLILTEMTLVFKYPEQRKVRIFKQIVPMLQWSNISSGYPL